MAEINQALYALHAGDDAKVNKKKLSHIKHALWVINVTLFLFVLSYKVFICKKFAIIAQYRALHLK